VERSEPFQWTFIESVWQPHSSLIEYHPGSDASGWPGIDRHSTRVSDAAKPTGNPK
jgi:hypothetical protein